MKDIQKIAKKIAACLALAASSNKHEAATAKKQAESLMKKYNISSDQVSASSVHETSTNSGGKYKPPLYIAQLASVIGTAFSCEVIGTSGMGHEKSSISFVGVNIKPELAAYTFDVLSRKLRAERKKYSETLFRFNRSNKTKMADTFCRAWIQRIAKQVNEFAENKNDSAAIKAYKKQHYKDLKVDSRTPKKIDSENDLMAAAHGYNSAAEVSIHRPVNERDGCMQLACEDA